MATTSGGEEATSFGRLLREHRLARGLTQEALAERTGLGARSIQDLEREIYQPRRESLHRILATLQLSIEDRRQLEAAGQPSPRRRAAQIALSGVSPGPNVAASQSSVHSNLPAELTSFIGREAELAQVHSLLASSRLVTLTGSGGCGKTRLALRAAAGFHEDFPDGVWLIELAALTDPALVPSTVARVLGARWEAGQSVADALVAALRSRNVLLVLDNCEHLIAGSAEVTHTLLQGCPSVSILATSRESLRIDGERSWRVPSLAAPDPDHLPDLKTLLTYDAVQLFVDRAEAIQPRFALTRANAPAVAQICWRLDGIALAIELAVARLRMLTVQQIAARLDDRFLLLSGGNRTALARQQTLRALIDWSHGLLTEDEKVLFRRLAIFAGGWTLEAAENVGAGCWVPGAGGRRDDVLDLLGALIDKSLVQVTERGGETRYGFLESIREYARERLRESGDLESLAEAHAREYLRLVEVAESHLTGPEPVRWLDRLEREHDNLRVALGWASEAGQSETSLRLVGVLWRFWEVHGHLSEGRRWTATALDSGSEGNSHLRARALTGAGTLAYRMGDYAESERLHRLSVPLYRTAGDDRGYAFALNCVAVQLWRQGEISAARAFCGESLAESRAIGDTRAIGFVLNNLGGLAMESGEPERAQAYYNEALVNAREVGDAQVALLIRLNLVDFLAYQGDYHSAGEIAREILPQVVDVGDRLLIYACVVVLAAGAAVAGAHRRAARLWGAAAHLLEAVGERPGPHDRARDEERLAFLRQELGTAAFEAAWVEGQALTQEEVVVYALELENEDHER